MLPARFECAFCNIVPRVSAAVTMVVNTAMVLPSSHAGRTIRARWSGSLLGVSAPLVISLPHYCQVWSAAIVAQPPGFGECTTNLW